MRVATCPVLIIGLLVGFVVTTRAQVSTINIDKICQAAAGVTVKSPVEQDFKICLDSEQKAREQIIKDHATYSAADKKKCIRTDVYLPSYLEWLTCLEMERHVREMKQEQPPATRLIMLPRARPAISY